MHLVKFKNDGYKKKIYLYNNIREFKNMQLALCQMVNTENSSSNIRNRTITFCATWYLRFQLL